MISQLNQDFVNYQIDQHPDMSYLQNNTTKPQDYVYCYDQDDPSSLVILKKPKFIIEQMYEFTIKHYLWVSQDKSKHHQILHELQVNFGLRFIHMDSLDEAQNFITNMIQDQKEKALLVYSKDISFGLQDKLLKLKKQEKFKYILCLTNDKNFKYIMDKSVLCIENNQELMKQLQIIKNRNYFFKKNLNFIFVQNDTGFCQLYKQTICALLNQKTNRLKMIDELQKLVNLIPNYLKNDDENKVEFINCLKNKKSSKNNAIKWYTKESFLYSFLNNLLRSDSQPTSIFYVQPYFKDLFNSILQISQEQNGKNNQDLQCFRGGLITQQQIKFLYDNIGNNIRNIGFLSASLDCKVPYQGSYVTNAYFIIKIRKSQIDKKQYFGFAKLWQHSTFPCEKQILFNVFNQFRVLKIEQDIKYQHTFYKIHLDYLVDEELKIDFKSQGDLLLEFQWSIRNRPISIYQQKYDQISKLGYKFNQRCCYLIEEEFRNGRVESAQNCIEYYKEYLRNSPKAENQIRLFCVLITQVYILMQIQNWMQAEKIYNQILKMQTSNKQKYEMHQYKISWIYMKLMMLQQKYDDFYQKYRSEWGSLYTRVDICYLVSHVLYYKGQLQQSSSLLYKNMELIRKLHGRQFYLYRQCVQLMVLVYISSKKFNKACSYLHQYFSLYYYKQQCIFSIQKYHEIIYFASHIIETIPKNIFKIFFNYLFSQNFIVSNQNRMCFVMLFQFITLFEIHKTHGKTSGNTSKIRKLCNHIDSQKEQKQNKLTISQQNYEWKIINMLNQQIQIASSNTAGEKQFNENEIILTLDRIQDKIQKILINNPKQNKQMNKIDKQSRQVTQNKQNKQEHILLQSLSSFCFLDL